MLYKSGGSPTPFSAELNRKPFAESIIWAFTQVSLHGSIILSGKGRLAGRFNALWNAEVLKEPSSMWKSKHLAHHHGRFLVERASSISLKAPRRSLPPPASHPPKGLQAILQELTQMSAATRTDAAAADRWCFTAGFLSGVMRGSDHGQAKGYVHHRKNFHCTISHSKDSFMLITTSLQFAPKFWRAAVPQRSWEDHARLHPDGQGKTRVLFEVQQNLRPSVKPHAPLLASRASGDNKVRNASSDSLTHSCNIPGAWHHLQHSSMVKPSWGQRFLYCRTLRAGKEWRQHQLHLSTESVVKEQATIFCGLRWLKPSLCLTVADLCTLQPITDFRDFMQGMFLCAVFTLIIRDDLSKFSRHSE